MRGVTIFYFVVRVRHCISTHMPHAGRDKITAVSFRLGNKFLLTRPMRGVTSMASMMDTKLSISTHTPHAGRDDLYHAGNRRGSISTHTPHAGRDAVEADINGTVYNFYSHAPCGA